MSRVLLEGRSPTRRTQALCGRATRRTTAGRPVQRQVQPESRRRLALRMSGGGVGDAPARRVNREPRPGWTQPLRAGSQVARLDARRSPLQSPIRPPCHRRDDPRAKAAQRPQGSLARRLAGHRRGRRRRRQLAQRFRSELSAQARSRNGGNPRGWHSCGGVCGRRIRQLVAARTGVVRPRVFRGAALLRRSSRRSSEFKWRTCAVVRPMAVFPSSSKPRHSKCSAQR